MPLTRRSTVLLSILLGAFFLCVYLLTGSADLLHNGDTDLRYQTTQAIVEHGRLWIAHPFYTDTRVALGRGGHLYAFYAPGQSILMVPFYVAGKFLAHHLSLPYLTATEYAARSLDLFLGAILAVLFFWLVLLMGYGKRVAVVLTLVFGLATSAWPDAQSALEQTPVDLFLLLGVIGVVIFLHGGVRRPLAVAADPPGLDGETVAARSAGRHREASRQPYARWGLAIAGAGAGLAFLTRYDAGIYLPVLVSYPLAIRLARRDLRAAFADLGMYAATALPFVGLIALWNYVRFGSPFLTGLHEQTFGLGFWSGLAGLLVSPGKGLIWYVPLLFLLPFAAPRFFRRLPLESGLFALVVGVTMLFYANVTFWPGDPSWGPRYLYTALPYLVLPLGEFISRWGSIRDPLRVLAVGLVGVSFLLQLTALSVTQWRFWYQLQAAQEAGVNASRWTGQPFRWGASHYRYYWNPRRSPILHQFDNVYQVGSLLLGDDKYRLAGQPDPYVHSNPAVLYPVNTLNFWWADVRHPLLGDHTRWLIAFLLALGALAALVLLLRESFRERAPSLIPRPRAEPSRTPLAS